MTDRWSQPKSNSLDLHRKVDDFARNKTVNKDTQARTPPPKKYLTTTNTPKKYREAVLDDLSRVMKAQNHGSPTQSKLVRPFMSPQKLKGNPISIPKTTITTLDDDILRSPPQQQRRISSLDKTRASHSPRKPVSPSMRRTVEPVSSREDMPDTFEEFDALSHREKERLGGERGFKKHLEKLQQPDTPAQSKKCRRDSSSESKHRAKDRPSLPSLETIGPPSSDSEEDDDLFKDAPAHLVKSTERSKKTVSTGASISAGSTGSTQSTESSKLGANRPLPRTAIAKPALLLTKGPMAKRDSIGSAHRRNSADCGSDDFEEDRLNRKNKDASAVAVKSTARSYKQEEDRRRAVEFFEEVGLMVREVREKDFSDRSQPQKSSSSRAPMPSDKSRRKDSSQNSVEDRGPRKKMRSPAQNVIDLSKDVDSHPIRSTSATKRTREPQSSSDSESELESIPKSKGKSEARSRTLSPPMPARAVASRDDGEGFRLPSPNKTKGAGGKFILPSPNKKKSCYESPSGYMSNQVIYMLSDDDIPRKVIEDDNVCPYCGDLLPEIKSKRLTKALAKIHAEQKRQKERKQERKEAREQGYVPPTADVIIVDSPSKSMPRPRPKRRERKAANGENGNEDSDSDSRRRRESQRADYDPFGSPPPSSLSSPPLKDGTKLSLMDRFEFCRVHIADEQIVPHGVEQGYPVYINFDKLEARVRRMESELRGIVEGTASSPFLEKALSNYERMGVIGARNPHFVLAGVRQTLPGYYGSKGSSELFRILAKMFLESQFLTHEKAHPQKPSEYIQHVLVPEAGVRLIAEDRNEFSSGDPISLERAREIMMESVEFGSYMHDIDS